ncbi:MAG: tRNA (adenosine(37)-N6)-dimethylallyltransferase MiaA, partial [Clostridia bacterium]|nr:tRNA (adenosine(37)-N6)-dimethylallyltransferase MiaA [Clostridia bacterium]
MVQADSLKKIVIVCGPTGSGKSALAVDIAKKFNGEVVSADSVAIYKGLDIGSAKPTAEETCGIKHHLIDIVEPTEEFSVSDYEKLALLAIEDILSRGKLPIICGGTGFYINSIIYKLSYGNSAADQNIRKKYEDIAAEKGADYLFEILKKKDEETAKKLHPNDIKRVIRALEIFDSSGVKKSDINDEKTPRYDYVALTIDFDREELYSRINSRVDKMIESGLEEEVKGLLSKGIKLSDQCMQGIGYKETAEAILKGEE